MMVAVLTYGCAQHAPARPPTPVRTAQEAIAIARQMLGRPAAGEGPDTATLQGPVWIVSTRFDSKGEAPGVCQTTVAASTGKITPGGCFQVAHINAKP